MTRIFASIVTVAALIVGIAVPAHAQVDPTGLPPSMQSGEARTPVTLGGTIGEGTIAERQETPLNTAELRGAQPLELPARPTPQLTGPRGLSADVSEYVDYFRQRAEISQGLAEEQFAPEGLNEDFYVEWELARELSATPLEPYEIEQLPTALDSLPEFRLNESLGLYRTPSANDLVEFYGESRQLDLSIDLNRPWQRLRPITVDRERIASDAQSGPPSLGSLLRQAREGAGVPQLPVSARTRVRNSIGLFSNTALNEEFNGANDTIACFARGVNSEEGRSGGFAGCTETFRDPDAAAQQTPAADSQTPPTCLQRGSGLSSSCNLRQLATGETERCVRYTARGARRCVQWETVNPFTEGTVTENNPRSGGDYLVSALTQAIDGDPTPLLNVAFNTSALDVGSRADLLMQAAAERYPEVPAQEAALLFGQDLAAAHTAVATDTTNPTHHIAAHNAINYAGIALSTMAN